MTKATSPKVTWDYTQHAAHYDKRADYAYDAISKLLTEIGATPATPVAEVGAGTGKLTETLVRLGVEVTAVEPDPGMLGQLRRELPSVRSLAGSAEDIPLPDGSADAVLAGQSLHWFDLDRAIPEMARVLVPGGVLAGLWNVDDDRVPWVAELAEISKHTSSVTLTRWRDRADQVRQDRMAAAGSGLFGSPMQAGAGESDQVRLLRMLGRPA